QMMDFELEFGIILGKGGTDIAKDQAKSHIFGYTIFNDFSARDAQIAEMQGMLGPTKGKSFDAGNAMGPYLVTADTVKDPYALKAVARING
ncbi:fumarylacetoacetate hydrolase family protein, partial [Acinetobacter baumannii]